MEEGQGWGHALGSTMPIVALGDPQSWMVLLRKEIGHLHEKKELPLDARWAWGGAGRVVLLGALGLTQVPISQPPGAWPRILSLKALLEVPAGYVCSGYGLVCMLPSV